MSASVWIVASGETAPRWETVFRAEGLDVVGLPWSRIEGVMEPDAVRARLTQADVDLVLLTSPNAARCVPPGGGAGLEAACVGEATAAAAREAGFRVTLVGSGTGRELAEALVRDRSPAPVLFLRGRDVRRAGLRILEAAGFAVAEEIVYEAKPLPDFVERVRAAPEPAAVAIGSPRAAEALADALTRTGRYPVRARLMLAMGEPTADRLIELGFADIRAPEVPGAAGLASLARAVLRAVPRGGASG